MGKTFNTTGICKPEKHYMVNIDERLEKIEESIARGEYFVINRARQYGKTTIIHQLKKRLCPRYYVFSISFEGMEKEVYEIPNSFCQRICRLLYNVLLYNRETGMPDGFKEKLEQLKSKNMDLADLSDIFISLCCQADKPVVFIIDEVDQASNQEIFLSFLGMLRNGYLGKDEHPFFQSVILSSVYDIKNLKLRIRDKAEHVYNSPWNIASDFTVDMSFSTSDIEGMLTDFENHNHTGMDIPAIATILYDYTSGYPFLVSRLCKITDEILPKPSWTKNGLIEAVKYLLLESNTLFDDIVKKIYDFPDLKDILYAILFHGEKIPFNSYHPAINIGYMFGFIKNDNSSISISNRIFETFLYNLFMSDEVLNSRIYKAAMINKNNFIRNKELDMEYILNKFAETFHDIYGDAKDSFIEENGRRFFLLFLKPIINGVGNYYIEARTRNMRRTDVIIDYLGKQYIIEMKIWHGNEYHKRGELQLIDYLDYYHLDIGYMVSFNFNKNKKTGINKIILKDKTIIEAVL